MRVGKLLTAVAASAIILAGCTQTDTTTPVTPAPPETEDAPDPDEPAEDDVAIAVFFVRSAPDRFYVEPEFQPGGDPNLGPVAAATEALTRLFDASAPASPHAPNDPELFTSVPEGASVNAVTLDGDTTVIDLSGFAGTSGASAQESTLLLQIAHTATYQTGTQNVKLLFDGAELDELWGHFDTSDTFEVSVFDLSPVTIETPEYGAQVDTGEVTFAGEALVFEATVEIVLVNVDSGATAHTGFVNATQGGPERGTWEFTFTFNTPGTYMLTASETDPSDGEGRPVFSATRTVTVN